MENYIAEKNRNLLSLQSSSFCAKQVFAITSKKAKLRRNNPTTVATPHTARTIRRSETMTACSLIHGCKESAYGILDTLTSKFKVKDLVESVLATKPSFVKELESKVMTQNEKIYYDSNDNLLRSLNIYYCHSVMGKSKYESNRKANKNKSNIPNYVPYKKLASYINSIDIGEVRSVHTDFGENLSLEESGDGMYRPLVDYVQRLSKFYLTVYPMRKDDLMEFPNVLKKSNDSFLFLLCFGGDGAPGTGTSFLVSFLNVTSRLMSSKENFMVFGANVDEKSTVVKRYIQHTVTELRHLEENIFELNICGTVVKVEYKVAELPNDMKMVCFLASELSNCAHYFTTFANANHSDCSELNKKI